MVSAIVLMPLLGCLLAGLFAKSLGDRMAQLIPTGLLIASALLSWIVFASGNPADPVVHWFTWFSSGDLEVVWSLRVDTLTRVMLVVVTSVSALVHVYSMGYMEHDPSKPRFFSYLSLFTFAMLMLVTCLLYTSPSPRDRG